jgi:hypothetical protein
MRQPCPAPNVDAKTVKSVVAVLLVTAGLINFLPVAGVLSTDILASAYGIPVPEGDLLILPRRIVQP